jgi:hypothetical protein
MLLILLVGGLFVALVTFKQSGSQRVEQTTAADSVVRYGLDYADHELMYSVDGADWRPPAPDWGPDGTPGTGDDDYSEFDVSRGWVHHTKYRVSPDSYYLLKVDYLAGPPAYIRIDSVAVTEGDTPSYTRRVAYKAVPLVSFGRFVTDFGRSGKPAVMGVPSAPPKGSIMSPLVSRWTGWLYSNRPLEWKEWAVNDFTGVDQIWAPRCDERSASNPAAPPAGIVVRDGSVRGAAAREFWVSRIEAPDLNATDPQTGKHRLRAATMESGAWMPGSSGSAYNTGQHGWGAGIYIDNAEDVQFVKGYKCPICGQLRRTASGDPATQPGPCSTSGCPGVSTQDDQVRDLDRLRQNWLRAGKTTASDPALDVGWNATREWYEPKDDYGRDAWVKITLYPTEAAANAAAAAVSAPWPVHAPGEPGLLIERSPDSRNWTLPDGSDSGVREMMFDYPVSGLIYAEGNVRIKGSLPPSSPNRDYSLTVCSGATIYVDGNILTPEDTGLGAGTRIGLLAEDYVCINPTQITAPANIGALDPAAVQEGDPTEGWYFALNPGESLGVLVLIRRGAQRPGEPRGQAVRVGRHRGDRYKPAPERNGV